ncbi:MAG: anti-sigma factor [Rhizobiaceae bacterium]
MPNDRPDDISEAELHAYVDGQLPRDRRAEIEARLARDPDQAAKVEEWRHQNEGIRRLFPLEASKPEDQRYLAPRPRAMRRHFAYAAAAAALFAAGVLVGGFGVLQGGGDGFRSGLSGIQDAARANFLIYTSEVRHPIEVGANEQAHLVTWLGKRVGTMIVTPDFSEQGFHLIGGRLVPFDGQPAALLMYEDDTGERLTILIGRDESGRASGFRFDKADDVQTYYWTDNAIGYALSGRIDRNRLEALTQIAHRQF